MLPWTCFALVLALVACTGAELPGRIGPGERDEVVTSGARVVAKLASHMDGAPSARGHTSVAHHALAPGRSAIELGAHRVVGLVETSWLGSAHAASALRRFGARDPPRAQTLA